MIEAIVAVVCGLLLASTLFPGGKVLNVLFPFKTWIGIVAIVMGIFQITSVIGIFLIAGGIVLSVKTLSKVPLIGVYFKKFGQVLSRFQTIIGVLLIILGMMIIINI